MPNLASAIGNQYIPRGRVFAHNVQEGGFFWETLRAQPPGASDTLRIAMGNINRPVPFVSCIERSHLLMLQFGRPSDNAEKRDFGRRRPMIVAQLQDVCDAVNAPFWSQKPIVFRIS